MKKLLFLMLSILILFSLVLSSCDMLLGLLGGDDPAEEGTVDIQAVSVEPLLSGGEVVGVRVILYNSSDTAQTVSYSIFLSEDRTLSTVNDIMVYEYSVNIPAGTQVPFDLSTETDIEYYIQTHSVSIDFGNYYIGVKVDTNNQISESNELNNEAVSVGTFPLEANYLDGTVSLAVTNAPAPLEGCYVYFGVIPVDSTDPSDALAGNRIIISSGEGSATAFDIDSLNMTDFTGSNWTGTGGDSYGVNWFIDINNDYDPSSDAGPGAEDITGDSFIITNLNGNTTVTLDVDTIDLPAFDGTVTFEILNAGDYEGMDVWFAVMTPDAAEGEYSAINHFTITDGTGFAVGLDEFEAEWIGTGGDSYNLGWIIDVNGNFETLMTPDNGDISNDGFQIDPLDGDQVLTANLSTDPVMAWGTIVAELDFPEAANGDAVFFIVNQGASLDGDPAAFIVASAVVTVDESGYALTELFEGYGGSTVFYVPDDTTAYEFYSAIDMNGPIISEAGRYNDPFDYVDIAMGGSEAPSPYSVEDHWVHYDSSNYNMMNGVIVDASDLTDYTSYNLVFNWYDDNTGALVYEGKNTIEADAAERRTVIYNDDPFTWSGDAGSYTLEVIVDYDGSGDLSNGELVSYSGVYYNDEAMEYAVFADELHTYINGTAGLYSETAGHEVLIPSSASIESSTYNLESPFTPYDGIYSLEVGFTDTNWFHMNFDKKVSFDITGVNRIYFSVNLNGNTDLTNIDYLIWDDDGTHGGMNIIDDALHLVSGPDGDGWSVYSLPLFPIPGTDGYINDGEFDLYNITGIALGWATIDSTAADCTVYFDDIYIDYAAE